MRLRKGWLPFLAVLVACCGPGVAYGTSLSAQQIARNSTSATVLLEMTDEHGNPRSVGSGFFISDGLIVTNAHVIDGARQGTIKLSNNERKHRILGYTAIDYKHDLVLLKVPVSGPQPLNLAKNVTLQVGDVVYAVGNPRGLEGTFSQGMISSLRRMGGAQVIQITAPISPGSSGGPVLDMRGQVVGVSVATFSDGQNLNFAVPSSYVSRLLAQSGPIRSIPKNREAAQSGSIFSGRDRRNTHAVVADNLLWRTQLAMDGNYTFSLRNMLDKNIRNVYCVILFHDQKGNVIDFDLVTVNEVIPGRLARRVAGIVDPSTKQLTSARPEERSYSLFPSEPSPSRNLITLPAPATEVEFRILDFEIIN